MTTPREEIDKSLDNIIATAYEKGWADAHKCVFEALSKDAPSHKEPLKEKIAHEGLSNMGHN